MRNQNKTPNLGILDRKPILVAGLLLAAIAVGPLVSGSEVDAKGCPFSNVLTGATEVPGLGDADGSGSASLELNQGIGRVCFKIDVEDEGDHA